MTPGVRMLRRCFSTKIYTKKGDSGLTAILKSPHSRLPKSSSIFTALGDNDELSSLIGLARCHCSKHEQLAGLSENLLQIQKQLQNLNSHLATPNRPFPTAQSTAQLEAQIDAWSAELEELKVFLLPGGGECASVLQLARAVCRRAERSFFALKTMEQENFEVEGGQFLNRLSDFLFTAARYANFKTNTPDIPFK